LLDNWPELAGFASQAISCAQNISKTLSLKKKGMNLVVLFGKTGDDTGFYLSITIWGHFA
jgi:hypothetical protein